MNRIRKSLSLLLPLTLVVSASLSSAEQPTKTSPGQDKNAAAEGAKIYEANCRGCHGVGGKGDICLDLTKKKKKFGDTDADLTQTISQGRSGGMPAWGNSLGAEKIRKLIAYIRTIEK